MLQQHVNAVGDNFKLSKERRRLVNVFKKESLNTTASSAEIHCQLGAYLCIKHAYLHPYNLLPENARPA